MCSTASSAALCLALAAPGAFAEEKKDAPPQAKPQGLPVETALAAEAPLRNELTATGTLYSNESVVIASEVAGKVTEIAFREGEKVAAGKLLVKLDQSILSAERDRAQASFNLSESNIRRAERLLQEQAISERERDEAYAQWRLNDANLRLAEAQLAKTQLKAPFAGLLGLRRVSVGEYLQPGEAIVTLDDIDPIKVDFRVPEVFAHQLKTGQQVGLTVDAVPGMFARVTLLLEERPKALQVPEEALIPRGDHLVDLLLVDGKVAPAPVKTGLRTRGMVEIVEGLTAGDVVITAGHIKVRPGMPVTALPTGGAAKDGK